MRLFYALFVVLCVLTLPASPIYATPAYDVAEIATLGGTYCYAYDMNDYGEVVGTSQIAGDEAFHAFIWRNGVMTDLVPEARYSVALDINNRHQIVGYGSIIPGSEERHAYVWQDGIVTPILYPDLALGNSAYAINDAGVIVLAFRRPSDTKTQLALWKDDWSFLLGSPPPRFLGSGVRINESLAVVCNATTASGHTSGWLVFPGSTFISPPTPGENWLEDINDDGIAVGGCEGGTPFSWDGIGRVHYLSTGQSRSGYASGINDRGQIVGSLTDPEMRACLWEPDGSLIDLNTRIAPSSSWRLTNARDINESGWILASAYKTDGSSVDVVLVPRAPKNISLSPDGGRLAFERGMLLTSVYGADNTEGIVDCRLLINPTTSEKQAACFRYDVTSNKLYIRKASGSGWIGGFRPGYRHTLSNGSAKLYCSETSVTKRGNTITVRWAVSLGAAYVNRPECIGWMQVTDADGATTGWEQMGAYTVHRPTRGQTYPF